MTRYVGVGYNLLRGNPEGDYDRGGIDPGIKITQHIFKFSYYDQGKKAYYRGSENNVPYQVGFQKFSSCSASNMLSAYSGEKSYQRQLSVNVESQGIIIKFGESNFNMNECITLNLLHMQQAMLDSSLDSAVEWNLLELALRSKTELT